MLLGHGVTRSVYSTLKNAAKIGVALWQYEPPDEWSHF